MISVEHLFDPGNRQQPGGPPPVSSRCRWRRHCGRNHSGSPLDLPPPDWTTMTIGRLCQVVDCEEKERRISKSKVPWKTKWKTHWAFCWSFSRRCLCVLWTWKLAGSSGGSTRLITYSFAERTIPADSDEFSRQNKPTNQPSNAGLHI